MPAKTIAWIGREWHWLLVAAAYAIAWYLPFVQCWKENWGRDAYALACAPYIPLGSALIIWAWRSRLKVIYDRTQKNPARDSWRRGNDSLLGIGIALLLFSYLVQVKGFEVFSLLVIATGVVYRIYGALMLRALTAPLLLLLIMVPLPDTLMDALTSRGLMAGTRLTGVILNGIHVANTSFGWRMRLDGSGTMVDYRLACSPACLVTPVTVALIAYLLMRRVRLAPSLLILVFGSLIALIISVIRLILIAFLSAPQPGLANALNTAPSLPFVVIAFGLTLLGARLSRRLNSRLPAPLRRFTVSLGRGVNILLSPLVIFLTSLGRLGVFFKRSERATEKLLARLLPRSKRRRNRR